MKKHKILASLCFLLVFFSTTTYGIGMKTMDYQPYFVSIITFENTFEISTYGRASVTSYLFARNVNKVKITANLQKYTDGDWKTIKSWSGSEDDTSCLTGGKWYIASGNTYRITSYGYTYKDDEFVESTVYISESKEY
ncbi:hypothetical protein AN1V17_27790 [Vallitalea sediminicola]